MNGGCLRQSCSTPLLTLVLTAACYVPAGSEAETTQAGTSGATATESLTAESTTEASEVGSVSGSGSGVPSTSATTDDGTAGSMEETTAGPGTSHGATTVGATTSETDGQGSEATSTDLTGEMDASEATEDNSSSDEKTTEVTETGDNETSTGESGSDDTRGDEDSVDTTTEGGDEAMDDSAESTTSSTTESGDETTETTDDGDDLDLLRELIDAICEWSYNCCNPGELEDLLGPEVKDEAQCSDRLFYLLTEDHHHNVGTHEQQLAKLGNAYQGLAFDLAYRIRLDRSDTLADGLHTCIDAWKAESCREDVSEFAGRCTDNRISRACQLDQLFVGELEIGNACNWTLSGPHTDIECGPGSSCRPIESDVSDKNSYQCHYAAGIGDNCTPPNGHDDTLQDAWANGSCAWGLYCDSSDGRCRPRPEVGELCQYEKGSAPRVDRMEIPCQHDLYCDPKTDRCTAECEEGYACGPRLAANDYAEQNGRPAHDDDWVLQYPTEDHQSPRDADDRCGAYLQCMPYRSNARGDDRAEKPGDDGYYFGKGTDKYGTSFECREPGRVNALCDTTEDCDDGYFCKKAPANARWYTGQLFSRHPRIGHRDDALPHHHAGEDPDGHVAEVGVCALELGMNGSACFLDVGFKNLTQDSIDVFLGVANDAAEKATTPANLKALADARCGRQKVCEIRQSSIDLAADFLSKINESGDDLTDDTGTAPSLEALLDALEASPTATDLYDALSAGETVGGNGTLLGGTCVPASPRPSGSDSARETSAGTRSPAAAYCDGR